MKKVITTTNFKTVKGQGWKKTSNGIGSLLYLEVENAKQGIIKAEELISIGLKKTEVDFTILNDNGLIWLGKLSQIDDGREWYEWREK